MSAKEGKPVLLEELTSAEFKAISKRKPLVIVPFGSVEEHGSHLPLCTDSFQAEEIARRVALAFGGIVCPPIRYGDCRSTRNFPGTLSISFDTLRMLITDILSELDRNGIDKILVITGHAGSAHMIALRLGAQAVVEKNPKLNVMLLSDYDLAYELRGKEFPEGDGHGGLIETSRILNIRPELVRSSRPKGKTWAPQFMIVADPENYFPSGVLGDSTSATASKGRKIDDYVVGRLCDVISKSFGIKRT
jgi:creatinine amidohydrolase